MSTPVIIALKAEGVAEVKAALKSVKQAIVETERESAAIAGAASSARLGVLKDELVERAKMLRDAQRETEAMLGRAFGASGASPRLAGSRVDPWKEWKQFGEMPSGFSVFKGSIDLATSALRQFAGFVVGDVIKPAHALETRAAQVANNSGGKLTKEEIQDRARAVGLRNNMDPMAIVEAAGVFQDLSGQPAMSFDMMKSLSTISKGRGFDLGELTKMAGAIYNADRGMSQEGVERVMLKMIHQGDTGSITLGEMARLQGRGVSPSRMIAGDFESRVGVFGAMLQAARGGMGSAADTAQGAQRFLSDVLMHGQQFSPHSFVKDHGALKVADPVRLIGDIFRKTGGDENTLKAAHFAVNARRFIGAFEPTFSGAIADAKRADPHKTDKEAREEAAQAVEGFVKSFIEGTSTMQQEEAKRDAVMATSGERWDSAVNKFKDKLLGVMPSVDKLIDSFSSHSGEIALVADIVVKSFTTLAEAALEVVRWYDRLIRVDVEGDAMETVRGRVGGGAGGVAAPWIRGSMNPASDDYNQHARGYWLYENGVSKFMKGRDDGLIDGSEDTKNLDLFMTQKLDSGHGVYEHMGALMREMTPMKEVAGAVAGAGIGGFAGAALNVAAGAEAKASADAHKELSAETKKASAAMRDFVSSLRDAHDPLNRRGSFGDSMQ